MINNPSNNVKKDELPFNKQTIARIILAPVSSVIACLPLFICRGHQRKILLLFTSNFDRLAGDDLSENKIIKNLFVNRRKTSGSLAHLSFVVDSRVRNYNFLATMMPVFSYLTSRGPGSK